MMQFRYAIITTTSIPNSILKIKRFAEYFYSRYNKNSKTDITAVGMLVGIVVDFKDYILV
jgi:hypothetical protein